MGSPRGGQVLRRLADAFRLDVQETRLRLDLGAVSSETSTCRFGNEVMGSHR